jgi:hypothetical protein
MPESFFKKAYLKYKEKVAKYLQDRGIDIEQIRHTFESYVRDFYLDKFDADDCADVIYSNVYRRIKGDKAMTVEQAKRIAEKYGFNVKPINESYGDAEGTDLSKVIEDFITGNTATGISKAETIFRTTKSIETVKAEFLDSIKPLVGHGISEKKYNEIVTILKKQKTFMNVLIYITGLMQSAQGNGLNAGLRKAK